jgi:hypothetical protein
VVRAGGAALARLVAVRDAPFGAAGLRDVEVARFAAVDAPEARLVDERDVLLCLVAMGT